MTPPEWQRQFEALRRFKRRFGHCRVSRHWPEDPGLARWVSVQRHLGGLTFEQVESLYSLGLDFGWIMNRWLDNFFALVLYRGKRDPYRLPPGRKADQEAVRLRKWSQHQRRYRDRLTLQQKRLLNDIDFVWEPYESQWQKHYADLKEFKRRHGHCDVPYGWPRNRFLSQWVTLQRVRARRGKISPERRKRLDAIGFGWATYGTVWERGWKEFEAYVRKHGLEGLDRLYGESPRLYDWLRRVRQHPERFAPEQRQMFARLGVSLEWKGRPSFEERIEQMRQFKREHGHCNVNRRRHDHSLAEWLDCQRRDFRRGRMPPSRRRALESMGVDLAPLESAWDEQFEVLRRFRQEHGHCAVGSHNAPNRRFLWWVMTQKAFHREGRLRKDRVKRLEELGFAWNTVDAVWEGHWRQLDAFRRRHGHCDVTLGNVPSEKLLRWIYFQRSLRKEGRLPEDRQRQLDRLGFVWSPEEAAWDKRVAELLAFRRKFGSFRIPSHHREYQGLWAWANEQRCRLRKGTLAPKLKAKLDAIGFR